ncbi:mucin-15 [Xyrichtys novacula]|uniref:Mucin-15 n=1 Tax=Xyrichtys novacula TaxID=13765 RepID=A0AAV1EKR6_XYRNO|nr:mucin-15 [Xyrichtys novacula]
MKLCLKITAGLLLLAQTFNLALLQDSTDSPGQPVDISWWRKLSGDLQAIKPNTALSGEEKGYDPETEDTAMEASNDYSGIASGSMAMFNEEEENVAGKDKDANESDYMDSVTTAEPLNPTTEQPVSQNITDSTTTAATNQTNLIVNATDAEGDFYNSTTFTQNSTTVPQNSTTIPQISTTIPQNSTTVPQNPTTAANATSFPDYFNRADFNGTTLAPDVNATQESTATSQNSTAWVNATEPTKTSTVTPTTTSTEAETSNTPTVFISTTLPDAWTTEIGEITTTVAPTNSSERGNDTNKAAGSGSSSDRGLASDPPSKRHSAWGAILGTAVAVMCVGLVAYVILKHKHQKDFSHRKLVEEFPSDPVLRLDNNEPLDLNFGGPAYYNPTLQSDNIQMTNFPGRL